MNQRKVLNNGFVKVVNLTERQATFLVRCPVFVLLKWLDFGGVFSVTKQHSALEFYTPTFFQDRNNTNLSNTICNELTTKFQNFHIWLYNFYRKLRDMDIVTDQVNMMLPQSTFIEFYWTYNRHEVPTTTQKELAEYFEAINQLAQ